MTSPPQLDNVLAANTGAAYSKEALENMWRRRFQNPRPEIDGAWWRLRVWRDHFENGKYTRKQAAVKLAPATTPERTVRKIAAEYLRPMNQGLASVGSAVNFQHFVENTYVPLIMPLLAKSTQGRSQGIIAHYLVPAFGTLSLGDLSPLTLQRYFSDMAKSPLSAESKDKIRDVLSGVLRSAVDYGLLAKNPVDAVRMPPDRKGKRRSKPYLTPLQFDSLLELIAEPYATIVYVAIYTGLRVSELAGLRVSELAGLRWDDIHDDAITIDERFCRGDWGAPKSASSNATISVNRCVLERIHQLKLMTVEVRAGNSVRKYKVIKSSGMSDLVFQSVRTGQPLRDNNILTRFMKPAARKLGLPWVNWRSLRTSHAVWLKLAGADPKDAQGQMRHSRISTTMDIYTQFVPESQQRVVAKLDSLSRVN